MSYTRTGYEQARPIIESVNTSPHQDFKQIMTDKWVEKHDTSVDRVFWVNTETKEKTWTKPEELIEHGPLPDGWVATVDPKSGRTYYVNKSTKETSWKHPTANKASAARRKSGFVTKDGQWEEVIDPTGRKYWYNKLTKNTSWTPPAGTTIIDSSTGTEVTRTKQKESGKQLVIQVSQHALRAYHSDDSDSDTDPGSDTDGFGGDSSQDEEENDKPASAETAQERLQKLKEEARIKAEQEAQAPTLSVPSGEYSKKRLVNDEEIRKIDAEDGDSDEAEDGFEFADHRHGFVKRFFGVGKAFDAKRLLSYKKSMIHKSLLAKNRDLDKICIQAFKNIMSYMGDRTPRRKHDPIAHAVKLLKNSLAYPTGVKDEVYLQLVKQTTNNPNMTSEVKGWELMTFCLATFPPSKSLKKFLTSYYQSRLDFADTPQQIKAFCKDCLERLPRIIEMGQREQIPTPQELQHMREQHPYILKVLLMSGHKTLKIDQYTKVGEVEDELIRKLGISLASIFSLYEVDEEATNVERQLDRDARVLDVIAAWGAHKDDEMEEMKVKKGVDYKHKDKVQHTTTIQIAAPKYNAIMFKVRLVLKTTDSDVIQDSEAINMLYDQAVNAILTGRYPAKKSDLEILSALQAAFGDYDSEVHKPGWLLPQLHDYIPASVLEAKKKKALEALQLEWEQKILDKYSRIAGFTQLEAKVNYLDYVQDWVYYGATIWSVGQRQFKEHPSPLNMCITCEGVLLMHPEKKIVLENYSYGDIVTFGHSEEKFIVAVGDAVQLRKLIFVTKNGKQMNNLVHDYIKFKVKAKIAQVQEDITRTLR